MKVWIVYNEWEWNGDPDAFRNCSGSRIVTIVDSEKKAIEYIQDKLRTMIEFKAAVLAAQEKFNCNECSNHECGDCLLTKYDQIVDIDEVPSEEFIRRHSNCVIYRDKQKTEYFCYEEHEVE